MLKTDLGSKRFTSVISGTEGLSSRLIVSVLVKLFAEVNPNF